MQAQIAVVVEVALYLFTFSINNNSLPFPTEIHGMDIYGPLEYFQTDAVKKIVQCGSNISSYTASINFYTVFQFQYLVAKLGSQKFQYLVAKLTSVSVLVCSSKRRKMTCSYTFTVIP